MNNLIYILLASLSPIGELRAAIPLGLALKENLTTFMLVAIAGNILVAPISFILLKTVGFRKIIYRLLGQKIEKKIARNHKRFETWEELALIPFVAIPLPGTGAYTATLIAEFLGLNRLKSTLTIAIGVCIAGAIVMLASLGAISFI